MGPQDRSAGRHATPDQNSLGRVLLARREALCLSVEEVAFRARLGRVDMLNYEADLVVPQPRTLERLAQALQTPAGRLLALRRPGR